MRKASASPHILPHPSQGRINEATLAVTMVDANAKLYFNWHTLRFVDCDWA